MRKFYQIVSLYFREQELFFYDLWWGSHSCQSIEIIYKGFTQKVFEFDEDTFSSWLPKKPIIAFPMWSMRMWGLDYTFYCSLRGNTHSFAWKSEQLRANTFTNGKKRLFECNFCQTGVQLIITTCTLNIKNTEIICTSALMIVLFILMPSRNAIELQTVW